MITWTSIICILIGALLWSKTCFPIITARSCFCIICFMHCSNMNPILERIDFNERVLNLLTTFICYIKRYWCSGNMLGSLPEFWTTLYSIMTYNTGALMTWIYRLSLFLELPHIIPSHSLIIKSLNARPSQY